MQHPARECIRPAQPICRALIVGLLGVLTSCSHTETTGPQAVGSVRITTDRASYARRDYVYVSFENVGPLVLGYNYCPVFLERRSGSRWVAEGTEEGYSNTTCDLVVMLLRPSDLATAPWQIPAAAPPGTYRLRFVDFFDDPHFQGGPMLAPDRLMSNVFTVY